MAKKVKLLLATDVKHVWLAELARLHCEECLDQNDFSACVLGVLELTAQQSSVPQALLQSDTPVIIISDFAPAVLHRIAPMRNRLVGLCERRVAVKPVAVAQYLETGLVLAKMLMSYRDQKLIWAAKGSLMEHYHLSESEAHRRLQDVSMKSGRSLRDIAQVVITAEEVIREKNR